MFSETVWSIIISMEKYLSTVFTKIRKVILKIQFENFKQLNESSNIKVNQNQQNVYNNDRDFTYFLSF